MHTYLTSLLTAFRVLPLKSKVNCVQPKSTYRHRIADQSEHLRRNQIHVCKVFDRNMLCAEIQILCTAEQGICVLGAVLQLDRIKENSIFLDLALGFHPQSVLRSQKIYGGHKSVVFLVQLLDCFGKGASVLFVSVVHRSFLSFFQILSQPLLKRWAVHP